MYGPGASCHGTLRESFVFLGYDEGMVTNQNVVLIL